MNFSFFYTIIVIFAWKMFRWMDAAKEQQTRRVYWHVVWALQIATGEYKNIDLLVDSKLQNTQNQTYKT